MRLYSPNPTHSFSNILISIGLDADMPDYSKWDRLEISDDEKDQHPNIDKSLMTRIKREQRARREVDEAELIEQLRKEGTTEALARAKKIENNRKLHVGNICTVVDEKTLINATSSGTSPHKHASSGVPVLNTALSYEEEFEQWVATHEETLWSYAELEDLKDMEEYMYKHPEILCEHACSVMLLKMLDLEMAGERQSMLHVVRQYLILRNILDLGKEARRVDEYRPFVQLFFRTVEKDEGKKEVLKKETEGFARNIIKRAEQKRLEEQEIQA
jgi:hypothetical protein